MTTFKHDPITPTVEGARLLQQWRDHVKTEAWPDRSCLVEWIEGNGWNPDDHDIVVELEPLLGTRERAARVLMAIANREQVATTAKAEGADDGVAQMRQGLIDFCNTLAARAGGS